MSSLPWPVVAITATASAALLAVLPSVGSARPSPARPGGAARSGRGARARRRRSRLRRRLRALAGVVAVVVLTTSLPFPSPLMAPAAAHRGTTAPARTLAARQAEPATQPPSGVAPPPSGVAFRPPVDAPITDGWRPPETPYGPGNRGWEYGTTPGDPVRAAGTGTVTFAGQVGGSQAVTVRHRGGIRTSYTHLDTVIVRAGDEVRIGSPVGTAGERLHFGVRLGEDYVDPDVLFRPGALRYGARLLPHTGRRHRPLHSPDGLPADRPRRRPPPGPSTPHRVLPRSPRAPGPGRPNRWEGARRWPSSP